MAKHFFNSDPQTNFKESMPQWENNRQSEKDKQWTNACGRKDFDTLNITKDTYICSIHFVDWSGPNEADPHPLFGNSF